MPDDLPSVFRLQPSLILTKYKSVEESVTNYQYVNIFGPDFALNHVKLCSSSIIEEDEG